MTPLHPIGSARDWTDLRLLEETRCEEPMWHYHLAMRWPVEVAPAVPHAVPALEEPVRLGWYRRGALDIEVCGHLLEREIDPLHWLEEVMRLEDKTIVSSKSPSLRSGLVGDVVATWETDGVAYMGRFFASKWGPRMFLVSACAKADAYDELADEIFAAIASFEALDDSHGMLAELVTVVEMQVPVKWTTYVPQSWQLQTSPAEEDVGGFQAVNLQGFDYDDVDGKLALGVARRSVAKKPRKAARLFLNALRAGNIELESEDFGDEEAEEPFERSWYCATDCSLDGKRGEVRCRVMMHPEVWVVAGVIGPQRQDDCVAWAQNKRALDVITSTLELD